MLMIVHYDGGAFAGWQRQKSDRTVQAELEDALGRLTSSRLPVMGAGRTDAGVHAVGQAAAAAVPGKWQPDALVRALNAVLPPDVWIATACRMRPGFDPRRHATERTYCYRIGLDAGARSPFRRRYEWALMPPLDPDLLGCGAAARRAAHSFRPLSAVAPAKPHYRCELREAQWQMREDGQGLEFWITADR